MANSIPVSAGRRVRVIVPLLVLGLGACSDQGFSPIDKGADGDGPRIEVEPSALDFGTLGKDDDPVVETFTVKSVGATDLTVDGIEISGDSPDSFTIVSDTVSFVLPPGASQDIDVAFAPMGSHDQYANAIVSSDDPDNPKVPVKLQGAGAVPELEITPDPLDFGTQYVGCESENTVTLTNVGTDDLTIDSVSFDGDSEIAMLTELSLPLTLSPNESTGVNMVFAPLAEVDYTGTLIVTSNEPMGTRTEDQMGTGKYAGSYTDEWEIPLNPPTDILFVVDNSCSMEDDQRNLATNMVDFANALSSFSADYQIAFITTDNPNFRGPIITPSTTDAVAQFQSQGQPGTMGSGNERGLQMAYQATRAGGDAGPGSAFLREDAILSLVFLSDERDQSNQSWSTYVSYWQSLKSNPAMVVANAIAGDYPGGCATAEAGDGYYQAVNATGGLFLSICSHWATTANMEALAEASITQDTFNLSHTPVPDTIEVTVNGNRRLNGWTYDETTNSVVFDTHIPSGGDTVEITYAGMANCD